MWTSTPAPAYGLHHSRTRTTHSQAGTWQLHVSVYRAAITYDTARPWYSAASAGAHPYEPW